MKTTEKDIIIYIVGSGSLSKAIQAILIKKNIQTHGLIDKKTSLSPEIIDINQIDSAQPSAIFIIAISFEKYRKEAKQKLIAQGVSSNKILEIRDGSDSIFLDYLLQNKYRETINIINKDSLSNIQSIEEKINKTPIGNNNKRLITFNYYGQGGGYRQHLNSIAVKIQKKFNAICFSDEPDSLLENSPNLAIESLLKRRNDRHADLAISANYINCSHPDIPKVLFMHEIYDHFTYSKEIIQTITQPKTQYIFTPSSPCFERMKELCTNNNISNKIILIPGGYPRLDSNIRLFKSIKKEADTIIYAPTLSMFESENLELTYSMSKAPNILTSLLKFFPKYKIVFRPHPTDLLELENGRSSIYAKPLKDALTICNNNPNLELDTHRTSYMKSYSSATLMVSDISSTAFTYAFTTNRPVIFFSPGNSDSTPALPDSQYIQDRIKLGKCVSSCSEMVDAINNIMSQYEEYQNKIKTHADQVIFNKEQSEKYFISNLDYIINQQHHPDWWYLSDHQ